MKLFVRSSLVLACAALLVWSATDRAFSHCEIPCGIYGDRTRIDLLFEDIQTIEKSMKQIKNPAINFNQRTRWVHNKEEHAKKIQNVVMQYFMTQRVKPKPAGDAGRDKYVAQLTSLHHVMVHAMKAKQTTDVAHCKHMRDQLHAFAAAYFSAEDLKHIREHHGHTEKK